MSHQGNEALTIINGILKQLRYATALTERSESMTWLMPDNMLPIWSRRLKRNIEGTRRHRHKWHNFDVEINDRLWSLWGGLHPCAPWFDSTVRGRQVLGCCVVAACAASAFRCLGDWSSKLLDAIVVNGDRYYRLSVEKSQRWDHQLSVDDMNMQCAFEHMNFIVQMELVAFGQIYSAPARTAMSLSEGLHYFFTRYQWGILECQQRRLAFGYTSNHEGGYFLYDCCEWGAPLYPDNMGASHVLRSKQLMVLLYCMVITLNIRQMNIDFQLYNVDITRVPDNNTQDSESEVNQMQLLKN